MKNLKVTMAALLAGAFAFSSFAANALVTAQDVQNSDKAEGLKVRSLEEAEQLAQQINQAQGGGGGDSILAQYKICYLNSAYVIDPGDPAASGDYDDEDEMEDHPDSLGTDHKNAYSMGVEGEVIGYFTKTQNATISIKSPFFRLYLHEVGTRREKVQIEIGTGNPTTGAFTRFPGTSEVITIVSDIGESIALDMNEFFDPDSSFPDEPFGINAVRIVDLDESSPDDVDDEQSGDDIAYGADIDAVGLDCEAFDENAITLKSLETTAEDGKNVVKFETENEKDSIGMKVFRINVKDIEEVEAVSPQGSPTSGSEYVVEDTKVKSGDTYIYLLQELDASGAITVYPENANEIEPVTAK
jgi:hypothetical protein